MRSSSQAQSAPQMNKPLALEFESRPRVSGQEALLDQYVRTFQVAQGIAQTIPQPEQPSYAQTALSKDRVVDFAKSVTMDQAPVGSAFRRVAPRGGGMRLGEASTAETGSLGIGDRLPRDATQQPLSMTFAAELDRALDLSLDPSPRLSMLAARIENAARQAPAFGIQVESR
jgi:hypothetical protein